MAYTITLRPTARKYYLRLEKQLQQRISAMLDKLAQSPRPHGVEKLTDSPGWFRVRVGDYRIIYEVRDKELVVFVLSIGPRDNVYQRR